MMPEPPEVSGDDRDDRHEELRELSEEEVEATLEDADIQTNTVSRWEFSLSERIADLFD